MTAIKETRHQARQAIGAGSERAGPMKRKAQVTYSTFNIADDLDNETVIAEYLSSSALSRQNCCKIRPLPLQSNGRGSAKRG
jgi:hypothetical protein